jgi:hypothetical protein
MNEFVLKNQLKKKTTNKLGKPTKLDPDHANEIIQ